MSGTALATSPPSGGKENLGARLLEGMAELKRENQALRDEFNTIRAQRHHGGVPSAAPFGRKGENLMGSRGFSFAKLIKGMSSDNRYELENSKIEREFSERLTREMEKSGWRPDRTGKGTYLAPFWPEAFAQDVLSESMYQEMKSLLYTGTANADPEEIAWIERKMYGMKGAATPASPAQSWIDQTLMGSFVPPPTFGPPIELLRNVETLMSAGATVMPLGPTGRLIMARLTGATQGGWSGENTGQTPTTAASGSLELSAKKVIGVVALPNELLRFASPAAEVLIRNDLFKTVALIADKGLLEGPGSSNVPLGLATMAAAGMTPGTSGTSTYGCNYIGVTSHQLTGQQVYDFLSAIEENNGEGTAWIMRPKMAYAFYKTRWTPYSGGTSQGGFLFEITRDLNGTPQPSLAGVKVVRTVQASNNRGVTDGSQSYILCLNAADYIFGLFGAIEFSQTDAGINLFASDQTAVRAILTCDGGMRHPGLVSFADQVQFTVN